MTRNVTNEYWAERAAHLLQRSIESYHADDHAAANLYRTLFRVALLRLFECPA